jgi:hypothetical protein
MKETRGSGPANELLERIDAVERGLLTYAATGDVEGLTEPDGETGEQWEYGQIWAHMAEFIPYWIGQAERVIAAGSPAPVPFGRIRTDPGRTEPIEQGRHEPAEAQLEKVRMGLEQLRLFILAQTEETWKARGVHQNLGVMDISRLVEEFLVKHLEEHVEQLQQIAP